MKEEVEEASTYRDKARDDEKKKKRHFAFGGKQDKTRHGKGGYGKTLKRIYINWAKKQKYTYVTGHVEQGISKRFPARTEIVKIFPEWYGLKTPFEYYRRPLG